MSNEHGVKAHIRAEKLLTFFESLVTKSPNQETFEVSFNILPKDLGIDDWMSCRNAVSVINENKAGSFTVEAVEQTVSEKVLTASSGVDGEMIEFVHKKLVFHIEDIKDLRRSMTSVVAKRTLTQPQNQFEISYDGKEMHVRLADGNPNNKAVFYESGLPFKIIQLLEQNGPLTTQEILQRLGLMGYEKLDAKTLRKNNIQEIRLSIKKNLDVDGKSFLTNRNKKYQILVI